MFNKKENILDKFPVEDQELVKKVIWLSTSLKDKVVSAHLLPMVDGKIGKTLVAKRINSLDDEKVALGAASLLLFLIEHKEVVLGDAEPEIKRILMLMKDTLLDSSVSENATSIKSKYQKLYRL